MNIEDYDKSYNEANFLSYVDNLFVQVNLAYMKKNLSSIDHFVSDNIYNYLNSKLEQLGENREFFDELNVKSTEIIDRKIDNENIIIKVRLISRSVNYIVDSNNNVISGNNKSRIEQVNILTFMKKIGTSSGVVRTCPNCGASIDVNKDGKCPFCKSIYDLENHDFVLINWEVL